MQKNEFEHRLLEMRAVGTDETMTIEGYAIVFDQPATHEWSGGRRFTETILRGALDGADMKNVPLRYNHNDTVLVMARTKNGSLRLLVDDIGLKIQADLLDTQSNRDLYKSIQEGLIDKMSFAFTVSDGGDSWTFGEKETVREVKKIHRIYDVSVVDAAFYDQTSVYARSLELLDGEKRRLDGQRRDVDVLREKITLKGKI